MMNIALVGVGAVGAVYARLLHDNPDVQLYCVMDAVRKTRAEEEGIYVTASACRSRLRHQKRWTCLSM